VNGVEAGAAPRANSASHRRGAGKVNAALRATLAATL